MSDTMRAILTADGLQRAFNAAQNGLQITIGEVAIGTSGYSVATNGDGLATQTALVAERKRVQISSATVVTGTQIDISFLVDGPAEFWMREVGYYLDDGTLFAVWSHPTKPLGYKSETVDVVVGLELVLTQLPSDAVTVQSNGADLTLIMTRDIATLGTAIASLTRRQMEQEDALRGKAPRFEDLTRWFSKAALIAAAVPLVIPVVTVWEAGERLDYVRDPLGTALIQADGTRWSPAAEPQTAHWPIKRHADHDDAAAVQAAFVWASNAGKAITISPGNHWLGYVDARFTRNLHVKGAPGSMLNGLQDWQTWAGDGVTLVHEITVFNWYDQNGVNVDVIDLATQEVTQWEEGTDYTRDGAVVTLNQPVPVGSELFINARTSLMRLWNTSRTKTARLETINVRCHDRGFSLAKASGSGIGGRGWRHIEFVGCDVEGSKDPWTFPNSLRSDSGIAALECKSVSVIGGRLANWRDLGAYFTGNTADQRISRMAKFVGVAFSGNSAGLKLVRRWVGATITTCTFEDCGTGILNGVTSGLPSGTRYTITSNVLDRIRRRAIDLRAMATGSTVTGNVVTDIGRNHDGTGRADAAGIFISGCPGLTITSNTIEMVEWAQVADVAAIQIAGGGNAGIDISHNLIKGFARGIRETGSETGDRGNQYWDNRMHNVSDPMHVENPQTRFSYIDVETDQRFEGRGDQSWEVGNVAMSALDSPVAFLTAPDSVTHPTFKASYNRHGDKVTLLFDIQINVDMATTTPGGFMRWMNLPFTAAPGADAVGSLRVHSGVPVPAGASVFCQIPDGKNYVEFRSQRPGENPELIDGDAVAALGATSATLRLVGNITYIAASPAELAA